jgi:tetratricopeptide (TPR) repeat protein
LIVAALVPAFALTHTVVSRYKAQREQLAREWSEQGERDFRENPSTAVADFETALSYGPDRAPVRLRLAEALTAAGRRAEARAHLLTLWFDEPGNGRINLELARLAAADGDLADATRYYHGAIDGAWERDATVSRREARLELARALLVSGQKLPAQAELIALIGDLPQDSGYITDVGVLLVDAGADNRALTLFERALTLNPSDGRAARLAGLVEFRAGSYQAARKYLAEAARQSLLDADARAALDTVEQVLSLDPFARGIGSRARAERTLRALDIARARVAACTAATPDLADTRLEDLKQRLDAASGTGRRAIERDSDVTDQLMAVVFEVERLPASACAPQTTADRALQLIAEQRSVVPR